MTPVFADSFYFLALLNEKDEAHQAALSFALGSRRPYVTTIWVLTEVGDACAHPSKREHFLELLNYLRHAPDTTIVSERPALFDQGVNLYEDRPDKHWSLTDCISFVIMRERGLTDALTGDHHFEQAGFRSLLK